MITFTHNQILTLAALCLLMMTLGSRSTHAGGYFWGLDSQAEWIERRIPGPSPQISYVIQDSVGLSQFPQMITEIQSAFNIWNRITGTSIGFTYGGVTTSANRSGPPGSFSLVFTETDEAFAGGAATGSVILAFTYINGVGNPESNTPGQDPIQHVQIVFNTNTTLSPSFVRTITTHEIGHLVGEAHSLVESSMMYPVKGPNDVAALSADDVAWARRGYPDPVFTSQLGTISGYVVSPVTLGPVPGIHVTAINVQKNFGFNGVYVNAESAVSALSGPDGKFTIPNLPPGDYALYLQDTNDGRFTLHCPQIEVR